MVTAELLAVAYVIFLVDGLIIGTFLAAKILLGVAKRWLG